MSKRTNQTQESAEVVGVAVTDTDTQDAPVCVVLQDILSRARPHASAACNAFVNDLEKTIVENYKQKVTRMSTQSNLVVRIPKADGKPSRVLFSCHVDTVDIDAAGADPKLRKLLAYDSNLGTVMLDESNKLGSCLGADDGVGVWIMLNMIAVGKPGTYVFHQGEEKGGKGAKAMALECRAFLREHDLAIAFDRPDNDEVITHQGGVRCASDKFADQLIAELDKHGLTYKKSTGGVYTDTKEYRSTIAECINLGVGYGSQHTPNEYLDYTHASALEEAARAINWDALAAHRTPTAEDVYDAPRRYGNFYTSASGYRSVYGSRWWDGCQDDDDLYGGVWGNSGADFDAGASASKSASRSTKKHGFDGPLYNDEGMRRTADDLVAELLSFDIDTLMDWVEDHPDEAVDAILLMCFQNQSDTARIEALSKYLQREIK